MSQWTPADWLVFLGGLGTFAGVLVTGILQILTLLKQNKSAAVSSDNNDKLSAVVAQTHEIARAVPKASTAPTEDLVNNDPATNARKAGL